MQRDAKNLWSDYQRERTDVHRNALVVYYWPLAKSLAGKIAFGEDAKSAAAAGLVKAVELFKPDRGVTFETYCYWKVRGAIQDELRRSDWVKIPKRLRPTAIRPRITSIFAPHDAGQDKPIRQVDGLTSKVEPDPSSGPEQDDERFNLLRGLSRIEKAIMNLYYYQNLTMKQIGTAMGLSESSVSAKHKAILKRLKERCPICQL